MEKEVVGIILAVLLVLLLPLVSASFIFHLNGSSIETEYGPEQNIKGEINISFSDEPTNAEISASSGFEGSIELKDFLDENKASYSCDFEDCEDIYVSSGSGYETKSFSLSHGQERTYGFVLGGNKVKITGLSFGLNVDNVPTCSNPLEIDILDDDSIEWKSKNIGNSFTCDGGTGCFDLRDAEEEVYIGTTPYCEKIELSPTTKFELGAFVKGADSNFYAGYLEMVLYTLDNNEEVSCELPNPSSDGSEISCNVDYENDKTQEYYICIRENEMEDQDTNYTVKSEGVNPCGFFAEPGYEEDYHDYYIFARGAQYENVGSLTFNQQEYENQGYDRDLSDYMDSYLEKYNDDCTDECVIPIKFKAYGDVEVTVSNIVLGYSTSVGSKTPIKKIHDTGVEPAKISFSGLLELEHSEITTPSDYGSHDLMLYLNDKEMLDEEVEIEVLKVPVIKNVFPRLVSAGVPTEFTAFAESPAGRNITEYRWSFGDGGNETTAENKATHIYDSVDSYTLILEIEDLAGFKTEKQFTIQAENPKDVVNSTITKYKSRIGNLSSQLELMPEWYKKKIEEKVDVEILNEELRALERKQSSATTSDEYIDIMKKLVELEIPYSIKAGGQGGMPFFVNVEEIEPSYLAELQVTSYDVSDEREYRESVAGWSQDVLDMTLNFKYVSAYYDSGIENLISVFNLRMNSKEDFDEMYMVIKGTEVMFKDDLRTREFVDSTGVTLKNIVSNVDRNVEFALSYVPIEEAILYLSPEFNKLTIIEIEPCDFDGKCETDEGETWRNCRADCKPWGWVFILFLAVFFAALIVYILLQFWYKTKYEKHLFKNKNDLYNIVSFIRNAERQGMSDSEIRGKLRQADWTSEQTGYAFKKLRGKSIMPFDFLKLFKKFERKKLEQKPASRGHIPRRTIFRRY